MVVKLADRVSESAQATGTGSFTLSGPSETQYIAFSTAFSTGDLVSYVAVQGEKWEIGHGTLLSETLLSRDFVWNTSDQSGINSDNIPESSLTKISFDSGTTITIFVGLPAHLVLALDESGNLLDPTPFRNTVYMATITDMKAMTGLSDSETVICLEDETGGIFTWDATDSTAADNIDTFRIDSSSGVGLLKRVSLRIQASFNGSMTVDAAAAGDSYIDLFTAKKASNATKYFRWLTDAANSAVRLGARLNQSGLTNFLSIYSTGDNADRVAFDKPSVLATRSDAQGIKAKTLAWLSGASKLALAVADAADNTTEAAYKEIALTKGGFIVSDVIDIYALKQVDPVSAAFSDGDRAIVHGSNTSSGSSSSVNSGNTKPLIYYWASTSSASADDINVVRPSVGSAATGNGRWLILASDITTTMTSGDATPSVRGCEFLITAGTTAITDFDDAYEGQTLIVQRASADIVITHNSSKIDLGGSDVTLTLTSPRMVLKSQGGVWRLLSDPTAVKRDLSNTTATSDALAEGTVNLYFKNKRVDGRAATITPPDATLRNYITDTAWALQQAPTAQNWYGAAYAKTTGRVVVCGYGGTGTTVAYSDTGGRSWTAATSSDETSSWRTIAWGNVNGGLFVMGNNTGTGASISTSPDGITWTDRTLPNAANITKIIHVESEGIFLAVASSGTSRIFTSPDGITWTARSASLLSYQSATYAARYNRIIAVASSGTGNRVVTSDDGGVTWTNRTSPADISWAGVAYSSFYDVAVMVANAGSGNRAAYSNDGGVTWSLTATAGDTQNWNDVCFSPTTGLFYAVNSTATGTGFMSSANGVNWTYRASPDDLTYRCVIDFPPCGGFLTAASTGNGGLNVAISAKPANVVRGYVYAGEFGIRGDGTDESLALARVFAAAAAGVHIDMGALQVNFATPISETQTANMYLRGVGAKITYTGSSITQSITITGGGFGGIIEGIEFDANSKSYCELAILQNTSVTELPTLTVRYCIFRDAYRDGDATDVADQGCFNLFIRGGYSNVSVYGNKFFNSRIKDGFKDDGVTSASGTIGARHLAILAGSGGPCDSINIENNYFNGVYCEDTTYQYDQDAVYIATATDSTTTDLPWSTTAIVAKNVFVNSFTRDLKSQVVLTKVHDNVVIRNLGCVDSNGYPVQGLGQCFDFQVGGGMAWANEFEFQGAGARDLFIHSGTREAPSGSIIQQLAEGPSIWGNNVYLSGTPALRGIMRLSTNYNSDTVMKLDDTKVVQTTNAFTAGISSTTMTVSAVANGKLMAGQPIQTGASAGTLIVAQLTGTAGGTGTYEVSPSQSVTSGTSMTSTCGIGSAVTTTSSTVGDTATINMTAVRADFITSFVDVGDTAVTINLKNCVNLGSQIVPYTVSGSGSVVRYSGEIIDGLTSAYPRFVWSRGPSGAAWPTSTTFGWESSGSFSTSSLVPADGYRLDRYGNPTTNNVIEVRYDTTIAAPYIQWTVNAFNYRIYDSSFGPRTSNASDLGTSSLTWKNVYAQSYYIGSTAVIDSNRILKPRVYTVATLPAATTAGQLCAVSDASGPTYGATLVGSGAVYSLALSDGSNWKAH